MSEFLEITGYGASRAKALAYTDSIAEQYFGPDVETVRVIGRATVDTRASDGTVLVWEVSCEYHPKSTSLLDIEAE